MISDTAPAPETPPHDQKAAMKRRRRREAEIRNVTLRRYLEVEDLITDADLRVVEFALMDRVRIHQGTPAGEAADRVLAKLHQERTR